MRNRIRKKFHGLRMLPVLLALFLGLALSKTTFAQVCEDIGTAMINVGIEVQQDTQNFNYFIQQEANYDWNNLSNGFVLLSNAWLTFRDNVLMGLNYFAAQDPDGSMATAWKAMAMELHVAQVDQTHRLGQLQDAQLEAEERMRVENYTNEAQTRYAPSELACEIDATGPGLNRAYQISRSLNRTLAMDDEPRRENAVGLWPTICDPNITYTDVNGKTYPCSGSSNSSGNYWTDLPTTSFDGKGQDVRDTYREYLDRYCDNTIGDQGCSQPGKDVSDSKNYMSEKDIGALLWGPQLTINPQDPERMREVQNTLRVIIDPLAPDTIPETVIPPEGAIIPNTNNPESQAPQGRTAILERNAESAYINTIYNVLGAMLSERMGGSHVDVSLMRAAAALPQSDIKSGNLPAYLSPGRTPDVGASYREIQEAMTYDRFNDPQYLIKMLGNPEQVLRERNTLSALRLQTMNDIYRRQEELLFMEAAEYGRDLNEQIPPSETRPTPFGKPGTPQ